jgi:hypothetical protein
MTQNAYEKNRARTPTLFTSAARLRRALQRVVEVFQASEREFPSEPRCREPQSRKRVLRIRWAEAFS